MEAIDANDKLEQLKNENLLAFHHLENLVREARQRLSHLTHPIQNAKSEERAVHLTQDGECE